MPATAAELVPVRNLIDEFHEDRIQKLEDGLSGVKTEVAVLGSRMETMEATIASGFKSMNDSIGPISAKLMAAEDEKKTKEAQAALVKKYKAPLWVGATAIMGAALAKFGEFLFAILTS